ncbi:hypothetical protein SLA2020_435890 [Shorea laevis]
MGFIGFSLCHVVHYENLRCGITSILPLFDTWILYAQSFKEVHSFLWKQDREKARSHIGWYVNLLSVPSINHILLRIL